MTSAKIDDAAHRGELEREEVAHLAGRLKFQLAWPPQ
jgi:hypothetical protein